MQSLPHAMPGGSLTIIPLPIPMRATARIGLTGSKVGHDFFRLGHGHAACWTDAGAVAGQPMKRDPLAGVAVKVIRASWSSVQSLPQVMPTGSPSTAPPPTPNRGHRERGV